MTRRPPLCRCLELVAGYSRTWPLTGVWTCPSCSRPWTFCESCGVAVLAGRLSECLVCWREVRSGAGE